MPSPSSCTVTPPTVVGRRHRPARAAGPRGENSCGQRVPRARPARCGRPPGSRTRATISSAGVRPGGRDRHRGLAVEQRDDVAEVDALGGERAAQRGCSSGPTLPAMPPAAAAREQPRRGAIEAGDVEHQRRAGRDRPLQRRRERRRRAARRASSGSALRTMHARAAGVGESEIAVACQRRPVEQQSDRTGARRLRGRAAGERRPQTGTRRARDRPARPPPRAGRRRVRRAPAPGRGGVDRGADARVGPTTR